jgi:hypothetical protein
VLMNEPCWSRASLTVSSLGKKVSKEKFRTVPEYT